MAKAGPASGGRSKSNFRPQGHASGSDELRGDLLGILETVELPIVVLDSHLKVAGFNRAASTAHGLTSAHIGQSSRVIAVLTDLTDLEKLCERAIADEAPYRHEIRYAGGWFLLRVAPYARNGQEATGIVLTLTNVTAFRASIEQAVYEREYTKTILNTVSDPLVVLDADLRVQTANRAFYEKFGVSREETKGVPLEAVRNHVWSHPGPWGLLKEFHAGNGTFQPLELKHEFPAIGRRTLLLDARRLSREGDSQQLILLSLRDISERKQAEEQLRRSEQDLSDFFENAAVGLHWVGPDGVILRANRAELDLLGYTEAEYIGHHVSEFHADRGAIEDILCRLNAGEELREYEARLKCKNGEIKNVLINSNVLWEEGRFIHTRCFTRDITDRHQAEQALREADRRKDQFLAVLAHELRNPLGPVRNAAHYLKLKNLPDPELRRPVEMIERQVTHMTRLIDDLLDVTRISHGVLDLRREPVDLEEVVHAAVDACRYEIEGHGHGLRVDLPQEPVPLHADRHRLIQVFCNLISNAAKYTPSGGRIEFVARRDGDTLEAQVRDNGVGIPRGKLKEIFELFARIDTSLERQGGGLGIGLTLSRDLVELHGGTIEARSEGLGHGSQIVVRLPITTSGLAAVPGACIYQRQPLKTRRILIADDNHDAAESLALLLESGGHDVRRAHDGEEALNIAAQFLPEVAFIDIGMPKVNGYDVASRIRAATWGGPIQLIALTGWGQESDRRRAHEAGFNAHLVKPVAPEVLTRLLVDLGDA